jgi:hypothetical protein
MAIVKKSPFTKTYDALFQFIHEQQTIPALIFDHAESIPEVLRGRHFLFNCAEGKNNKKQKMIAIQIAEQKGTQQIGLLTAHSLKDKKDMRMTVMFHGEDKLDDDIVDVLITGVKTYVDEYQNKKEVVKH